MKRSYDVVVAGLGVMGGSVAMHLSRRGLRVLGVDRHRPPHTLGSSHGRTRLIREAYYEHPLYVPLVRRAYELWRALEREIDAPLLRQVGSIMVGHPDSEIVTGTLGSALQHHVDHEVITAARMPKVFPMFQPLDDMVAVYEPGSSLLHPEAIVAAQLELAIRAGAMLEYGQAVAGWEPAIDGVDVRIGDDIVYASHLVLSTGAWIGELAGTALPVTVERQLQQWWSPDRNEELFKEGRMPVSMWQLHDERIFYTMPDLGDGVKIGWHHSGPTVTADTVDRSVSTQENAAITDLLRRFLPHAKGERLGSEVCLYTNTPDGHFVIDAMGEGAAVTVLSACSGHGFKFGSVLGEVVADRLTKGQSAFDLTPFRLGRWGAV